MIAFSTTSQSQRREQGFHFGRTAKHPVRGIERAAAGEAGGNDPANRARSFGCPKAPLGVCAGVRMNSNSLRKAGSR